MPRWLHNSSQKSTLHWSSKTAAKGSLTMNIMVAGGLYQSISGLPENSKGAGDKVANYHYIGLYWFILVLELETRLPIIIILVYLMTNQHFKKHFKREMGPNIK